MSFHVQRFTLPLSLPPSHNLSRLIHQLSTFNRPPWKQSTHPSTNKQTKHISTSLSPAPQQNKPPANSLRTGTGLHAIATATATASHQTHSISPLTFSPFLFPSYPHKIHQATVSFSQHLVRITSKGSLFHQYTPSPKHSASLESFAFMYSKSHITALRPPPLELQPFRIPRKPCSPYSRSNG